MGSLSRAVVPAKLENLESLVDHIAGNASQAGLDAKRVSEIQVAAEEALVNVISYAYGSGEGEVEVTCGPDESDQFVIDVVDGGVPFDPLLAAEPDTSLDVSERKIGGLGILLIRKLMDEVFYRRDAGRNILTLVVRKRGPAEA
jgi:serine/threonine-protein kinase RsbW